MSTDVETSSPLVVISSEYMSVTMFTDFSQKVEMKNVSFPYIFIFIVSWSALQVSDIVQWLLELMSEPKTSSYFINSIKRSVMNDDEEREMEWTCGTHTKTLQIKLSKTCIYEFMWVTWRGEGERERPGHSSSNHKPVFRSRDLSPPIRGQYSPEPHCTGSRRLYKCPLSVPLSPALLSPLSVLTDKLLWSTRLFTPSILLGKYLIPYVRILNTALWWWTQNKSRDKMTIQWPLHSVTSRGARQTFQCLDRQ